MQNQSDTALAFFDASGREVKDQAAYLAARAPAGVRTATACLELHGIGLGKSAVWQIQLTVNPNIYPFLVLGGTIGGDICNVPTTQWVVTGGSLGLILVIEARRVRPPNAPPTAASVAGGMNCATAIGIIGYFQPPASYPGTYGTNGSNHDFSQTTLFKGWQACP